MLKFYYDLIGAPARALYLLLKLNKVDFVDCPVALRKGEQFTDDFKSVNPFQRVPLIDHDGFKLTESVAIAHYLCSALPDIAANWLPHDSQQRAKVLEFLLWQGSVGNLRHHGAFYFRLRVIPNDVFLHRVLQRVPAETELASAKDGINRALTELEEVFLRRGEHKFIGGLPDVSLADLFAVCELEQPIAAGYDFRTGRPEINRYMQTVSQRCGEKLYAETHQFLWKLRKRVLEARI